MEASGLRQEDLAALIPFRHRSRRLTDDLETPPLGYSMYQTQRSRSCPTKPTTSACMFSSGASERNSATRRRANSVMFPEVLLQYVNGLVCLWIAEQWLQSGSNIVNARSIVAHEVVQIVGVFVLSAETKGERLENDVGSGSTYPYRPRRAFSDYRLSRNRDPFAISEGKMQSWCDDGCEIRFNVSQSATAIIGKARWDQKVDRNLFSFRYLPALPGQITPAAHVSFKSSVA